MERQRGTPYRSLQQLGKSIGNSSSCAARQTTLREGKDPGKPKRSSVLQPRRLPLPTRCRACSLSMCLRAAAEGKTHCSLCAFSSFSGASEELSTRTDQRTKKAGANPRGGREGYELRCHFLLQLGGVTRKHDVGRTSEREAEVKVLSNPTSPIFHSFRPGEHTFTNARTSFSQTQKPVLLTKRYHQDRRHVASQPCAFADLPSPLLNGLPPSSAHISFLPGPQQQSQACMSSSTPMRRLLFDTITKALSADAAPLLARSR